MPTPDMEAFVRLPEELADRRLRRVGVREVRCGDLTVFSADGSIRLGEGDEILLFYEIDGEFHSHSGQVIRTKGEGSGLLLDLRMIGEPTTAENRSSPRLRAGRRLTADIGNECMCPLLDISAAGFAVLGRNGRSIGEERRATIRLGAGEAEGSVRLASMCRSDASLTRYGFRCAEDGSALAEALAGAALELRVERPVRQPG